MGDAGRLVKLGAFFLAWGATGFAPSEPSPGRLLRRGGTSPVILARSRGIAPDFPAHDEEEEHGSGPAVKGVVLGGGSFGLAMACALGRNGVPVTLLMRNKADAEHVNEHSRHPKYLSDLDLPASTVASTDAGEALRDASFVVHCVPVQHSRRYLRKLAKHVPPGIPVLCTSKGIDRKTLSLMCEILPHHLGDNRGYAFLSGPSFAREIAEGLATAVVVASEDRGAAADFRALLAPARRSTARPGTSGRVEPGRGGGRSGRRSGGSAVLVARSRRGGGARVAPVGRARAGRGPRVTRARRLASDTFRVFTSADVVGLEVGGAVKNVLALAAGMAEGLDLGTNAVTALVTRGLYEMQRIALAMGGRASTIGAAKG